MQTHESELKDKKFYYITCLYVTKFGGALPIFLMLNVWIYFVYLLLTQTPTDLYNFLMVV